MTQLFREERRVRLTSAQNPYQAEIDEDASQRERDVNGDVLIKGSNVPFELTRQGRLSRYLSNEGENTPLSDRAFFRHDIRTQSGKHTHQGGIGIFVMEGLGYTTVNGQSLDWKKYDLILLPNIPEQCEHQHFNREPGRPAVWCAFIYEGSRREAGNQVTQNTDSPEYSGTPTV